MQWSSDYEGRTGVAHNRPPLATTRTAAPRRAARRSTLTGFLRILIAGVTSTIALATATARAGDESCQGLERARQLTYTQYGKLILDDFHAFEKESPNVSTNAVLGRLEASYKRGISAGDMSALRKLVGLGPFAALAARVPPRDAAFRLVCELAKGDVRPALTLDALTFGVIAVDGARQSEPVNRALAKSMINLAGTRVESDPNREIARRMFDEISGIVIRCAD
jgi:hypothetical protein